MKKNTIFVLALLFFGIAQGQDRFENTKLYDSIVGSPKADLNVVKWISGHWKGEALGGTVEEIWTPALGGSMMCVFKLVIDDEVQFYEIVTVVEENGSLILRLKHFNADLHAWEEKDETIDFRLVHVTQDRVYFDGLTFEQVNAHKMNVYVVVGSEGKETEIKFQYTKV